MGLERRRESDSRPTAATCGHRALDGITIAAIGCLIAIVCAASFGTGPARADEGGKHGEGTEHRQRIVVRMDEFDYQPSHLSARAGEPLEIEVRNEGDLPHDLTFTEVAIGTRTLGPGEHAVLFFPLNAPGTYRFSSTVDDDEDEGLVGTLALEAVRSDEGTASRVASAPTAAHASP